MGERTAVEVWTRGGGMWKELIFTIYEDMKEPVAYLPIGLLAGGLFLLFWFFWDMGICRKGSGQGDGHKEGGYKASSRFLLVAYLAVLINTVFFSREPGSRTGVSLELFGTWGETVTSKGYVIENILLFIPYGMLVPGGIPFFKKGYACVLSAAFSSMMIELVQLITGRGYCQLDDVVMNTIGATFGWCCWRVSAVLGGRLSRFSLPRK